MARKPLPAPEKASYVITDRAGPYVAGRRVEGIEPGKDGKRTLLLTPNEASYELVLGSIEPAGEARKGGKADV